MTKQIKVNNTDITLYEDGSIGKLRYGKTKRSFGSDNGSGYMRIAVGYRIYYAHRLIAQAFLADYSEDLQVDHIDGDRSNNRPENLRMLSNQGNGQAHQRKRKGCSTKYRGVTWHSARNNWKAQATVNEKRIHIGSFKTSREAAIARDAYVHSIGYPLEGLNFPENFCPIDASQE